MWDSSIERTSRFLDGVPFILTTGYARYRTASSKLVSKLEIMNIDAAGAAFNYSIGRIGGAPCAGSHAIGRVALRALEGDTPNSSRNAAANADGFA